MANTYPSVTARSGGARPKPRNFQRGLPGPANDNKIGRVVIGKVPKRAMRFGGGGRLPPLVGRFAIGVAMRLLDDYDFVIPSANPSVPSGHWALDVTCPPTSLQAAVGGPNAWFGGDISCDGWFGVPPDLPPNGAPITSRYTSADYIVHSFWGDHPQQPDPFIVEVPYRKYTRVPLAPVPTPIWHPSVVPSTPEEAPQRWGIPMPLAVPTPLERPVPWDDPLPGDEPSTKPEPKPEERSRPRPGEDVFTLPPIPFPAPIIRIPVTPPGAPAPVLPGVVVTPAPGDGLEVQPSPDYGRDEPPRPPKGGGGGGGGGRRTVQHKANLRIGLVGVVWKGVNETTEVFDFMNAMHKSLPKKRRLSPKASKTQRLKYMMGVGQYSRPVSETLALWAQIDLAEALQNYVNMEIGDHAAALGSKSSKKLSKQIGSQSGLDHTLREHQDNLSELSEEKTTWVPELDIDMESGVISVTGPLGVFRFDLKRRY